MSGVRDKLVSGWASDIVHSDFLATVSAPLCSKPKVHVGSPHVSFRHRRLTAVCKFVCICEMKTV